MAERNKTNDLSLHMLLDELEKVKQQLKRGLRALENDDVDVNTAWSIVTRQVDNVDKLQARIRTLAKEPPHAPSQ